MAKSQISADRDSCLYFLNGNCTHQIIADGDELTEVIIFINFALFQKAFKKDPLRQKTIEIREEMIKNKFLFLHRTLCPLHLSETLALFAIQLVIIFLIIDRFIINFLKL